MDILYQYTLSWLLAMLQIGIHLDPDLEYRSGTATLYFCYLFNFLTYGRIIVLPRIWIQIRIQLLSLDRDPYKKNTDLQHW